MQDRHRRSELRSLAYHKAIAKKLKEHPKLWSIPLDNIQRWSTGEHGLRDFYSEWLVIFKTSTKNHILSLIVKNDENATRLRSNSPFTGILSESERMQIYNDTQ